MRRLPTFASLVAGCCCVAVVALASAAEDPNIARIRENIAAATDAAAMSLIHEQGTDEERGDVALVIGAMFEMGMLEDRDPMRALHYYSLASEFGSPEADCALGNLYYAGAAADDGVIPRDQERARSYYSKAAAGGNVKAMLQLGAIYADGMGVDPDPKRALPYFMDAASRGDPNALERLEPVMRQAKEWEDAKPGRKANFPTSREQLIKPELARQAESRNARLDRTASKMFVELNKRVAASMKHSTPSYPMVR